MTKYIDKSALIAEIERRIKERDFQMKSGCWVSSTYMYEDLLDFLDTIEVKDANEALRTEYEKGRHDVIEKAMVWLTSHMKWGVVSWDDKEECVRSFKEAMKE